MKIIKGRTLLSACLLTLFMSVISFSVVFAVDLPTTELPTTDFETILENIVNWIVGIITLVAVIVIVIAGILWTTSGGDEDQAGKARRMLTYGLVGLAIALAAFAMVQVIVERIIG